MARIKVQVPGGNFKSIQTGGASTIYQTVVQAQPTVATIAPSYPSSGGGEGVNSITGTTNQITASASTGAVTLSISSGYIGQTSITTLGTITSGTWEGTLLSPIYGGTGVNNGSSTLTLGGDTEFSGAYTFTGTLTANTAVTFPTSGTLLTSASAVTSITGTANQITASASTGAVTLSLPSAITVPGSLTTTTSITAGTGIICNGYVGGYVAGLYVVSGNSGITGPDIAIQRAGGSANTTEGGSCLLLQDTTYNYQTCFQQSGNQTELWQYNGTNWYQVLYFDKNRLLHLPQLTASTGTTLIESGGVVYSLTSSEKYKVDIEDLEQPAIDAVLKLRPVWYRSNPKTTGDRPDFGWYGLIAEEVAKVDPRLVHFEDQGRGKSGMKPRSVAYERLAVLLIPHVKELYARIAALEARLK